MANKHVKRCSTSYVNREMQIKTTRYNCTPTRMAKIRNTDNTQCQQGCGTTGTLTHCWQDCKTLQPLWKAVGQFLIRLNILPYHAAIAKK